MVDYNLAFQEIRDRIRVLNSKMMVTFFSDFHEKNKLGFNSILQEKRQERKKEGCLEGK